MDKRLKSKEWRVSNLYKIVDKNGKLITFKRNKVQQQFFKEKHTRNIILKSRQLGFTTDTCIDTLDDVVFNKNFTSVIIAHDIESVKKIFKKIKVAWEHFDKDLKDYIGFQEKSDSANELSFSHGSSIRVATSSRADTVNRLHVSEFGKICAKYPHKAIEIITGAIPSVPEGGRIDIESTAEGETGEFHDMFWTACNRGEPQANKQFKSHFFPWTDDEGYTLKGDYDIPDELKEYQKKLNLTDEQINWYFIEKETQKDKMFQEYPSTPEEAFIGSGHKLFNQEKVAEIETVDGRIDGNWIYYKDYVEGNRYALGADVAEGVGQDSSTIVIIDFTDKIPEVVAEYASNTIAPDIFAYEIMEGGKMYGNCVVAPERNNHGWATITKLKEIYSNVYSEKSAESKMKRKQSGSGKKYGWGTTAATKPMMMYDLAQAINEGMLQCNSKNIKIELRTYDKEDLSQIRFDDNQTKHWDLVIALAIAWQMRTSLNKSYLE